MHNNNAIIKYRFLGQTLLNMVSNEHLPFCATAVNLKHKEYCYLDLFWMLAIGRLTWSAQISREVHGRTCLCVMQHAAQGRQWAVPGAER